MSLNSVDRVWIFVNSISLKKMLAAVHLTGELITNNVTNNKGFWILHSPFKCEITLFPLLHICWVSATDNKFTVSANRNNFEFDDLADAQKRKSKWDSAVPVTLAQPTLLTTTATLPGVVSVTTTASGTKTTVISAVGTILKKAKQWHKKDGDFTFGCQIDS